VRRLLVALFLSLLFSAPVYADYQDPYIEIAKGNIPGHSFTAFQGIDEDIDTVQNVMWPDVEFHWPSSAIYMNVSSSSVNDTMGGPGVWNITIYGLDADYRMINETIAMNGTNPVPTTLQYFRINRLRIETAGSSGVNVGDIYIGTGPVTGGKPATVYNMMTAGYGVSSTGTYTVPDGYTAYLVYLSFGTDGTKIIHVWFQSRCLTCGENAWRTDYHDHFTQEHIQHRLPIPFPYTEHTDIQVAASSNVGDAFGAVDVFLVLVKDGYSLIEQTQNVAITGGSEDVFNTPLLILTFLATILSLIFYMGERVVPWFIALMLGLLSSIILIGAGFYWVASGTVIPVYAWLFIIWGTINLVLFAFFTLQLQREYSRGYAGDEELYGPD